MEFSPQEEVIGFQEAADPELPQRNPVSPAPQPTSTYSDTHISIDQNQMLIQVPLEFNVLSDEKLTMESKEATSLVVGTNYRVTVAETLSIEVEGAADVLSQDVLTLDGTEIKLGAGAGSPEAVIKGDSLRQWFATFTVDSPFGPLPATAAIVNTLLTTAGSTKSFVE